MADVIKSYLVSLSSSVDKASFDKFTAVLKGTENTVAASISGIAGDFLKFQIAGTTAFATVGFGLIAYIDKLGQADLKTKLLATQNMMSLEQYRSVSMALKTLGVSLNDVFFGPKELQDRFHTLIEDQKQLTAMLGPNYEQQMQQVRDVSFQLDRLEIKGEYFGMKFASDLLSKLGFGEGGILLQLQRLNDFVMQNMPQWSDELATGIVPILKDFYGIMKDLGGLILQLATDFTNLVGVFAGDTSLQKSTITFQDFGRAIEYCVEALDKVIVSMEWLEKIGAKSALGVTQLFSGVVAEDEGKEETGDARFHAGFESLKHAWNIFTLKEWDNPRSMPSFQSLTAPGPNPVNAVQIAQEVSRLTGIDPKLIYGQMGNESGNFKHFAGRNNFSGIKIPGTNTFQNFGSLEDYAQRYASILNEKRYVENGIRTARTGAEFAAALKTKSGTYYGTDSQSDYARNVDSYARQYDKAITIGTITVNSAPNFSPDQHVALVKKAVKDGLDEHTRALIAETNGAFQ